MRPGGVPPLAGITTPDQLDLVTTKSNHYSAYRSQAPRSSPIRLRGERTENRHMGDYAKALGAKLRGIRQQQGLSLHGVEQKSGGRWKAVVVGSYERGDRAVTVQQLAEPAAFYCVPR